MGFTILVVEDDHDSRVSLRQILEAEGYCVLSTIHGSEAMTLLKRDPTPNAVLLDLNLPTQSGQNFIDSKMQDAALRSIPIILLRKPIDFKKLLGELQTVFKSE
ncbi:MAG: response regulator [Methylotenera sp.]|nr:response regulator [Oligoflexia bacterium]